MQQSTQSVVTSQAQSPVTPEQQAAVDGVRKVAMYTAATVEQQAYLEVDAVQCVVEDGLPLDEYLDGLTTWDGDAASYLAVNGVECSAAATAVAAPSTEQGPTTPEEQLAVDVEAAQKQAAEQRAASEKDAAKVLDQATAAHVRGERDYLAGMLDAGRLLSDYVSRRLALGHTRANTITTVAGRLAESATSAVVDAGYVNNLLLVYHAHKLLAVGGLEDVVVGKGKKAKPAVAYGHYRDAWCQLVQRVNKDTAEEGYVLLPGLENRCVAVFAECVGAGMSKDSVIGKVRTLMSDYAAEQAKQAAAAKVAAQQQAVAAQQQAAAENQAVQEAIAAKQEADKAGDPGASERAAADLIAKQQAAIQATAAAEQAQRDADAKAKADKQAAEAAAKAAAKLMPKPEPKPEPKPAAKATATAVPGNTTPPLPTVEEEETGYTAQQAGTDAAQDIVDSDAPDDAVEVMLDTLVACKELCGQTTRALQAALVMIRRQSSPSPVEAAAALAPQTTPSTNGATVAA